MYHNCCWQSSDLAPVGNLRRAPCTLHAPNRPFESMSWPPPPRSLRTWTPSAHENSVTLLLAHACCLHQVDASYWTQTSPQLGASITRICIITLPTGVSRFELKLISMSTFVVAGAALTALGLAGRAILRQSTKISYYRGGFEPNMTRREASLILGINSSNSNADRVKQAHKKIILLNHPDRGGSPYLAAKINEAKTIMLKHTD